MGIERRNFGITEKTGEAVHCFTLSNKGGMKAEILTYGGVLKNLWVPAEEGLRDVVLGFDTLKAYEQDDKYMGALVGRVANRIRGAAFTLNGKEYCLPANSGGNCLHGGVHGFHQKVWSARIEGDTLCLSCLSPDGEEGFPGNLEAECRYSLTDDGALEIEFRAWCDADTLVNLTNHSYFNLEGHQVEGHQGGGVKADRHCGVKASWYCGSGDDSRDSSLQTVADHLLQVFSHRITEIDETAAPTGALLDVANTPFDLREPRVIGEALAEDHPQLLLGAGFDHNYALKAEGDGELRLAARLQGDGLQMECLTTQPGVQLYTANYLAGEAGKEGRIYALRSGVCLETQGWPDAIHHRHFPSVVLRRGQLYHQTTQYRFTNMAPQ